MIPVKGYAALSAGKPLEPFQFSRRDPEPHDIVIEILYCGICHSDIHQARNEWGGSMFPMVPGHEIVGRVTQIGKKVRRFKKGSLAGVGCFVDSCRVCPACKRQEQQFCKVHTAFTYSSTEMDLKTPTQGGYSSHTVVHEDYALKIPKNMPLERTAPLLCAGITTYSPLRQWKVGKNQKVGVIGLGGLGHMAVKLAASMRADVTVFSTSLSKEADARRLGAQHFVNTKHEGTLAALKGKFQFILNTVSAPHDLGSYLELLDVKGVMVLVGVPPKATDIHAFSLIMGNRRLAGSLIGGIRQTQEMLNYCAKKKVYCDVEVIPASGINEAYERVLKGNVHYRAVIDASTF